MKTKRPKAKLKTAPRRCAPVRCSASEASIRKVATALARAYAAGWKEGKNHVLTAEEWAEVNWESFCVEAVEALTPNDQAEAHGRTL